jgi:hypothetical protein
MSVDNPLRGAPRIHGELLKLGFEVAQSSVAKYMIRRPTSPSQGWLTFLRNHSTQIAAMDVFVAPREFFIPSMVITLRLFRGSRADSRCHPLEASSAAHFSSQAQSFEHRLTGGT